MIVSFKVNYLFILCGISFGNQETLSNTIRTMNSLNMRLDSWHPVQMRAVNYWMLTQKVLFPFYLQ